MATTCGRPAAMAMTDTAVPSGDQRNRGEGTGTLKICTLSPTRTGDPPLAGTRNSAASCSFFGSDGVDTTYATRCPSGEMRASTMARSVMRSSTVTARRTDCAKTDSAAAAAVKATAETRNRYRNDACNCARVAKYTGRPISFCEAMMSYTYHELKEKTIQELREIAKGVENQDAVQGYSQLNKDHLLPALCNALGIAAHEHHDVTGIDKPAIKKRMRDLKAKRQAALEAHDAALLKNVRRQIHHYNRQIRAHAQ